MAEVGVGDSLPSLGSGAKCVRLQRLPSAGSSDADRLPSRSISAGSGDIDRFRSRSIGAGSGDIDCFRNRSIGVACYLSKQSGLEDNTQSANNPDLHYIYTPRKNTLC